MHGFHIVLTPLWQEWSDQILQLVSRLHRRLPPAEPRVELHWRELEPVDEGVGAQYQLTLNGDLLAGRYQAAYFIIQVQLVRQRPPRPLASAGAAARIIWRIDSVPALQRSNGAVELLTQRREEMPVAERERLRRLFEQSLTVAAASFFARIRAGVAPE